MRALVVVAIVVSGLMLPTSARAQEQKNPDELKKLYEEAVSQLKAAQDRKNELAAENEKLQARIVELETRLAERNAEAADYAERTWFLRAHLAAWQRFLDRYPDWRARWEAFLAADVFDPLADWPIHNAPPGPG